MKIRVWLVSGIVFGALGLAIASVPAQAKNKTVKECTAEWKDGRGGKDHRRQEACGFHRGLPAGGSGCAGRCTAGTGSCP